MKFVKMHGLGNDFVLVSQQEVPQEESLQDLAVRICNRHLGVGADGLVIIGPSNRADLKMRIFNSDGSEAEMCGNAIRCLAKYAYEEGIVSESSMVVDTLAGFIAPEIIFKDGEVDSVRVDMGQPGFNPADIPVSLEGETVIARPIKAAGSEFAVTCVSMGNPHCIVFVPDIKKVKFDLWGPAICTHSVFPKQTNVEFVQILDENNILMRVWERGAGETLACGTGACASAVASFLNGKTNRKVTVHLTVGNLDIEWDEETGRVFMTGPAAKVFEGNYFL
ncbi:MAG TPA: diaminopimelate epimerase [Clostridia bacterium]|nr:diaminopimelate epimerase [Clostridia bacterium]